MSPAVEPPDLTDRVAAAVDGLNLVERRAFAAGFNLGMAAMRSALTEALLTTSMRPAVEKLTPRMAIMAAAEGFAEVDFGVLEAVEDEADAGAAP